MSSAPGDHAVSTDFNFRFMARVSTALADNDDLALSAMLANALRGMTGVGPLTDRGTLPRFGAGLSYDDTRFRDLSGVAVRDGVLMVGIECQNAQYPYREADADLPHGTPYETRLDRVLARLSTMSEGPPGEVAGCVSNENDELFHEDGGQPILRCRDGVLRRAWVPVDHDVINELRSLPVDPEPRAQLPVVIPPDAIRPCDGRNLEADLDLAMLRRRFAPLDLAANRTALAAPSR